MPDSTGITGAWKLKRLMPMQDLRSKIVRKSVCLNLAIKFSTGVENL
jgi:hypothetical protein